MSIYVYITRRRNPLDPGENISLDEWKQYVAADPSFRAPAAEDHRRSHMNWPGHADPTEAIWTAHPDGSPCWFEWWDGNIHVKNPDDALIVQMLAIAAEIGSGAGVVSDMGEVFNADGSHYGFIDGEPW